MHPFGLCSGFLIPPWLTFPQAPLSSRTVGFPESAWGSDQADPYHISMLYSKRGRFCTLEAPFGGQNGASKNKTALWVAVWRGGLNQ